METEKDLTLELKDDLGEIELIKCVAPGIFYVVAVDPEEAVPAEYYIVDKCPPKRKRMGCHWNTMKAI